MSMVRPWWHPCLALVILLGATASAPPAYRYRLDAPGSQVSARVAYFGVGHKTVRFPVMRGALRLVPERTEAIDLDVELDARALDAGGKTDSDYLKGKAFFDVANHPVVRFSGNRMTMTGETTARVDGRITARGVTRPAVLTVTFAQPPARASGRDRPHRDHRDQPPRFRDDVLWPDRRENREDHDPGAAGPGLASGPIGPNASRRTGRA